MRIAHLYPDSVEAEKNPVRSENIEVNIQPQPYEDDFGIFDDRKEYMKFLYTTERVIRDSCEYVKLMDFIKHRRGLDHCGIHRNLSSDYGIRIEEHHHPFQLSDICVTVINKRYVRGETLKMQDIAHEVMELHYLRVVGIYPLCTLCHSYYHSDHGDNLFIPMRNVFGEPEKFVEMYKPYFSDALRTKWNNIQALEKGYRVISENLPKELQKKYIYVSPFGDGSSAVGMDKLVGFIRELNGES